MLKEIYFVHVLIFHFLTLTSEANRQYKLDSGGFDVLSKVDKDAPLQKFLTKRSESSPPPGFKNGTIEVDDHDYYSSKYSHGKEEFQKYWLDLAVLHGTDEQVAISPLSNKTMVVQLYKLKFSFPYYGHQVDYIGVGTNGFLYTGTLKHSLIADFQYIAPLQANFDVTLNSNSSVYTRSTEKQFTAQWNNVLNLDHTEDGPFTFQVSLFQNGTIHFVYKEIPVHLSLINSTNHPLRVGISDAFFWIRFIFNGFLYGVISEYHAVDLLVKNVSSNSVIILTPLANCISANSCLDCSKMTELTDFVCGWCSSLNRCSDGLDRHRQSWLQSGCSTEANLSCIVENSTKNMLASEISPGQVAGITIGIIVTAVVLSILVVVLIISIVLLYGYRHPDSGIGRYMIEHHTFKCWKHESASYDVSKSKLEEYEDN